MNSKEMKERFHEEIINKAVFENGIATIKLDSGENVSIPYGNNKHSFPDKLFQKYPDFYKLLLDEIFDEIHPY